MSSQLSATQQANIGAILDRGTKTIENFLLNAWNGVLTPDQVAQIDTATRADILRASAGDPQLAQDSLAQWSNDLSAVVATNGGVANGFTLAGLFSSPGAKNVGSSLLSANFSSLFVIGGVALLGVAGWLLFERAKG